MSVATTISYSSRQFATEDTKDFDDAFWKVFHKDFHSVYDVKYTKMRPVSYGLRPLSIFLEVFGVIPSQFSRKRFTVRSGCCRLCPNYCYSSIVLTIGVLVIPTLIMVAYEFLNHQLFTDYRPFFILLLIWYLAVGLANHFSVLFWSRPIAHYFECQNIYLCPNNKGSYHKVKSDLRIRCYKALVLPSVLTILNSLIIIFVVKKAFGSPEDLASLISMKIVIVFYSYQGLVAMFCNTWSVLAIDLMTFGFNQFQLKLSVDALGRNLGQLRNEYNKLQSLMNLLNDGFGPLFLVIVGFNTISLILVLFNSILITSIDDNDPFNSQTFAIIIIMVIMTVQWMILLARFLNHCMQLNQTVGNCADILKIIKTPTRRVDQYHLLVLQEQSKHPDTFLNAYHAFIVDRGTILSIFNLLLTYLVVLLQFKDSGEKKIEEYLEANYTLFSNESYMYT